MNFFYFNQQTGQLVIANDFWVCVVTWLLLTLVTYLGYRVLHIRSRPRGENDWHWQDKLCIKGLKSP